MSSALAAQTAVDTAHRISRERPMFHLAVRTTSYAAPGEEVIWNALPETLEFIATHVSAGDRTIEVGAGASTVVFASAGSVHTAISPVVHEHRRIRDYCKSIDVSIDDLTFVAESSDAVVPTIDLGDGVDFVLIDGTHAFPYAIVEWHFLRRALRPGGLFLLDDVPIPAVAPVYRFMRADPDWELVAHLDRRTAAFRKLRETPVEQTWRQQGLNRGYPDYSFLSPGARLPATAAHHVKKARSALGGHLPAVRRLRRRLRRTTH